MATPVLIAADHALFRQGVRRLLDLDPDLNVVGECADGSSLEADLRASGATLLILDTTLTGTRTQDLVRSIRRRRPPIVTVLISTWEDDPLVADGLAAGAAGWFLKTVPGAEMIAAVRSAAGIDAVRTRRKGTGSEPDLTEREVAVLRLLARGMSNREIARELNYSESTVKNRLSTIFDKIGVQDRTQAAIYAVRSGLAKADPDATD